MKCNVANGWCGAYKKDVDNRCSIHFDGGRDVKICSHRLRMNRLERHFSNGQDYNEWYEEKDRSYKEKSK